MMGFLDQPCGLQDAEVIRHFRVCLKTVRTGLVQCITEQEEDEHRKALELAKVQSGSVVKNSHGEAYFKFFQRVSNTLNRFMEDGAGAGRPIGHSLPEVLSTVEGEVTRQRGEMDLLCAKNLLAVLIPFEEEALKNTGIDSGTREVLEKNVKALVSPCTPHIKYFSKVATDGPTAVRMTAVRFLELQLDRRVLCCLYVMRPEMALGYLKVCQTVNLDPSRSLGRWPSEHMQSSNATSGGLRLPRVPPSAHYSARQYQRPPQFSKGGATGQAVRTPRGPVRHMSSVECYNCVGLGHIESKCPAQKRPRTNDPGKVKRFNCGLPGHIKPQCPLLPTWG